MKEKKKLKILKYVTYLLLAILLIEMVYFGIKIIKIRKESTYYSSITSAIKTDEGYVAVGLSDSKHSKYNKYKNPGYNKPYIWVYDKDLKVTNEIKFDKGYNGTFNSIIEVSDGYIAVGKIEMSEENHKNSTSEGILIKYDKDFNIIWRKNYDLLGITEFTKVIELEDKTLAVVGTSIYENNVIGNHTNGGAILTTFTSDGEVLLEVNVGGPRTDKFNDIVLLEDGFIVVGVKAKETGIIYKYNFKGKELWHKYYGPTDSEGLTSITKISDDKFVITGSKLEKENNYDSYKAALITIDNKGKIIKSVVYEKDKIARFEDSIVLDDKILVAGIYGKQVNKVLDNDSVVVTYDFDLNKEEEKEYSGNNKFTITSFILNEDSYLVVGNTNSKIKSLKTNGMDYYPIIEK